MAAAEYESRHYRTQRIAYRPACSRPAIAWRREWEIFSSRLADDGASQYLINDIMMGWWDDDDGDSPVNASDYYVRSSSGVDFIEHFEEFIERCNERDDVEPNFPDVLDEDIWRFEERLPAGTPPLPRS